MRSELEAVKKLSEKLKISAIENAPMSEYTSFRIGGPAELMLFPRTSDELAALASECRERSVPLFVLGNGSNLLVSDWGIEGAVVNVRELNSISYSDGLITADCGALLSKLCTAAADASLSGAEFAFGIPGSIGGAVFMNAGAYGGEIKDIFESCTCLDRQGRLVEIHRENAEFGYRSSRFSAEGGIVLSAVFRLHTGKKTEIRAGMNEILEKRRSKQPLELPSAGSAFKRPQGNFAGALIEQCGLKGKQVGGAAVSEKHAGFIVNLGGATAADVKELIAIIRKTVEAQTGILLEPEIKIVGKAGDV